MKRHSRGVTLIELMTAIAVIGLLLALATPTFREFTRNNSVVATQNDLVTAFNLARSEALRRNRPVSVCSSANGTTCGDEEDWNIGWLAFTDRGTAGQINAAAGDELLQAWQSPNTTLLLLSDGNSFIRYLPTGMSALDDPVTIEVAWEDCVGHPVRQVTVTVAGAITGQVVTCS